MRDYVYFSKEPLGAEFCESIIKIVSENNKEHFYNNVSGEIVDVEKNNEVEVFPEHNLMGWLYQNCIEANKIKFGFDLNHGLSPVVCKILDGESEEKWTKKGDISNPSASDSKLTCLIQLTDENYYDGGDLEIDQVDKSKTTLWKKRGTMILFPSFLKFKINKILGGKMYYILTSFDGPHWR